MTTFINKGDIGYKPFGPQPIHIISNAGPIANPVEKDGLFYNQPERRHALIETVTDYQEWAEEGWKQQHGTYEAAKRFLAKLQEEVGEVETAYISFITNGSMPDSKEGSEFLSELGDVLWCATALASNSSSDIDSAFLAKSSSRSCYISC
jgi:NTP pyrophosphatase (non-canonical NTP hydrolase)